jgi:hypothetical protein
MLPLVLLTRQCAYNTLFNPYDHQEDREQSGNEAKDQNEEDPARVGHKQVSLPA